MKRTITTEITVPDFMTPSEVAAKLHVDPKTVTRWAKSGRLSYIWTPGGHRRYFRAEVESFLAPQRVER